MKQYCIPSPQYTANFPCGSNSDVLTQALTNKLVPAPEEGLTEEQDTKEDKDSEQTMIQMTL